MQNMQNLHDMDTLRCSHYIYTLIQAALPCILGWNSEQIFHVRYDSMSVPVFNKVDVNGRLFDKTIHVNVNVQKWKNYSSLIFYWVVLNKSTFELNLHESKCFFCFSTYHITSELIVKEMSSHVRWKQVEKDSPGIYLYEILTFWKNSRFYSSHLLQPCRASMSNFSSRAWSCHKKSNRAIHSTWNANNFMDYRHHQVIKHAHYITLHP